MNCELCQKDLEAYHEGKLPEGMKVQVKVHLESCAECAEAYQLISITNMVMNEERNLQSNPFLYTRIIAGIEALDLEHKEPAYRKVLKPALIIVSVAAAVFIGVMTGSIYKPSMPANRIPVEMTYMNDGALESVGLLANK
jgi:anti-sigma factor RsiW